MPKNHVPMMDVVPEKPPGLLPAASELPLFAQLQQRLRQDVLEGRLQAGQKLPSESSLQAQFNVSRITVRQAISALQADGLVETFNGKGSFVTRPASAPKLGMLTGLYEHMRARGKSAQGQVLSVRSVKAPAATVQALRLKTGAYVKAIATLRLVDGVPVAYGVLEVTALLADKLLEQNLESEDAMSILESRLGYRLESTHIETTAILAGEERAGHLGVSPTDALLGICFVPHDIEGTPLLRAQMYFRPDQFVYKAVIRR